MGAGLTFVVVFSELTKLNASPSSFALAFVFSTAPGLLGSMIGEYSLKRTDAVNCLILAEMIGFCGLIFPWLGVTLHSITLLQMTELASSFAAGITLPSISHYAKYMLPDEDLAAAALIDTLAFSCYVLFGVGLGVILSHFLDGQALLLVNCCCYIVSIAALILLPRLKKAFESAQNVEALPKSLSPIQKASLALLPALSLVGTPAMALLPVLVPGTGDRSQIVLALLFARSLGQLCGPMLVKEKQLEVQNLYLIIFCMVGFLVCYQLIAISTILAVALVLVFLAHVLSNIVFSLGWYGLLRNFNAKHVAAASARSYRKQVVVGVIVGGIAGLLADKIGGQLSLFVCSGIGLIIVSSLLIRMNKGNKASYQ